MTKEGGWSSEIKRQTRPVCLGLRIPVEHPQALLSVPNQLRGGFVLNPLSG